MQLMRNASEKTLNSSSDHLPPSYDFESPLVSIIIVNFNGREVIENCLNSVLRTNRIKFEVIVVDNGSTDGSIEFVQNFVEKSSVRVKLIKNQKNLGFAEGNNVGIGNSSGKYIAFLNNDTIVESKLASKYCGSFGER